MLEDDGDDRQLTLFHFSEQKLNVDLEFLVKPGEVLPYLNDCYNNGWQLPSLIILDKNVPSGCGLDVLREIKGHPVYRQIPTVMVSGSESPGDIKESYRLGANSYIVKPFSTELTAKKIAAFASYWFEISELPKIVPKSSLETA
jgi:CheY-like chemotaxis protein